MAEYGYINEGGYLVSKILDVQITRCKDNDTGDVKQKIISIEEQADDLSAQGYKPVDVLNESRLQADEGYCINIAPYDNGDRISYKYEVVKDLRGIKDKIQVLKKQLSSEDYKITKCYESSLLKKDLPYNVDELHIQRQAIRDKINDLERLL